MKRRVLTEETAVSPVIATILMVAITVVLAATLYMMMPQADEQDQLAAMSGRRTRTDTGWIVSIDGGEVAYNSAENFRIYNRTSGASIELNVVTSGATDPGSGTYTVEDYATEGNNYIQFNDNDNNDRVNGGDTIRIYDPDKLLEDDYEFRIIGTSLNIKF